MAVNHGRGSVAMGMGGSSTPRLSFSSSGPSAPPPRKKQRASDPHPSSSRASNTVLHSTPPTTSQQRQTQLSQFFSKKASAPSPPPAQVVVLDDDEEQETWPTPRGRPLDRLVPSASTSTPRTSSPSMSMLGKAPSSTLRSQAVADKSSYMPAPRKATRPISPRRDAAEEQEWLQRAQALAGRRSRRWDETDVRKGRGGAGRSNEDDDLDCRAHQTLARKPKSRRSDEPQGGQHSLATKDTTRRYRSRSPPTDTTTDTTITPPPATPPSTHHTPIQETPFMHESLSGMSLLPWEMDAALKAADYRISAGLQPTRKDIEAREKLQRDAAQKAHREALIRSHGTAVKAPAEMGPRREPGRKAPYTTEEIKRVANADGAPKRSPPNEPAPSSRHALASESTMDEPRPVRQALASKPGQNDQGVAEVPSRRPNVTFKPIFQSPPVSPSRRAQEQADENRPAPAVEDHPLTQDEHAISKDRTPYALRQHGTVFTNSCRNGRSSPDMNTPTSGNATLLSPRTNRKIYALETQGTSPLPFPLDVRPDRSAPTTPRKSTLKDALLSKHASPSRRLLQQQQQQQHGNPQRASTSSSSLASPPPASAPSSETLPLESDYDDDDDDDGDHGKNEQPDEDGDGDDTILAPGPCPSARQKRSLSPEQATAGHREASVDATQPLPFDDGDEEEEQQGTARGISNTMEETQHLPFPPGDSETETEDEEEEIQLRAALKRGPPTGWSRVNEAWTGVDLTRNTLSRLQSLGPPPKQVHPAATHERQSNLGTHGFKGHPPRPRRPNAFFSRDTHDVLSDDDGDERPADDPEATQVLPWGTQSSHTEEEDEDAVAAYRARGQGFMNPPACSPRIRRPPPRPTTSNGSTSAASTPSSSSSWLPSSQELHKDEHRHVRDFLRGL